MTIPYLGVSAHLTWYAGKLLFLKVLSLFAGAFLIVAGIAGTTAIVFGGGFIYIIASLYAIIFGFIVLTIEIKDRSAPISVAYQWINVYLKFLTLQARGLPKRKICAPPVATAVRKVVG